MPSISGPDGNQPWNGCSTTGDTFSPTCRNVRNYKTYSECRESGLFLGWRNNEIWWYCTSLAAGQKFRSPNSSDQDVGNNPTECGLSASPLRVLVVQKRAGDSIDAS